MWHKSTQFLSLWVILLVSNFCSAIQLGPDGGYKLLLAVDDDVDNPPSDLSLKNFITAIQNNFDSFSKVLFDATDGKFYIESVDLLIPEDWKVLPGEAEKASTFQSVSSSDIRLSTEAFPYVENLHPCGLPGQFIELPSTFFTDTAERFGPPEKALLTQWARFRYGVWEEHGYPETVKLPYFYLGVEENKWLVNSCTNGKLAGKYEFVNGSASCNVNQANRPNKDCRFKPDPVSPDHNATSSLMSFHWVENVTRFCDHDTHVKHAPNRQNLYCDYKSVWEVIRTTPDYASLKTGRTDAPTVLLKTFQHQETSRPLYILLDRGHLDPKYQSTITRIVTNLAGFVGGLDKDVVVGTGTFDASSDLTQLTPWAPIGTNQDEVVEKIGSVVLDGVTGNFAESLIKVAHEIETLKSPNGVVLLVIKIASPDAKHFASIPHELEVLNRLQNANTNIFAVELLENGVENGESPKHLEKLATAAAAVQYLGISKPDNNLPLWPAFILAVENALKATTPFPYKPHFVEYKGPIVPNSEHTIVVTRKSDVTVNLVVSRSSAANLVIKGDKKKVDSTEEWAESPREVFSYKHAYNEDEKSFTFMFQCSRSESDTCKEDGFYYVVENPTDTDSELSKLKVTAYTSIEGTSLDFGKSKTGFAVFAKVEHEGKPVTNVNVIATAIYNNTSINFELNDKGNGIPDLQTQDGVFSGNFVPPKDGSYAITIKVTSVLDETNQNSGDFSFLLLPVDQDKFGCEPDGCGVELKERIAVVADLPDHTFANVLKYPKLGHPEKVTDFEVFRSESETGIDFTFTSPSIIGGQPKTKATSYEVYGGTTVEDFLKTSVIVGTFTETKEPGNPEKFSTGVITSNYIYFAIVATADKKASDISSIERIDSKLKEESGTTPPSGDPGSTTDPNVDAETPFFQTAGGVVLIVFLVLLGVVAIGGGFWWYRKKRGGGRGGILG